MGGENHEIRAEFHVDDQSEHVLHHIKESFEHVKEEATEVSHEVGGMLKGAAGMAIGIELAGAVETIKSIGEEAYEAATGMEEQEKTIRGVLIMIDEEGASLEDLTKDAHELNEEFQTIAISTGASKESIVNAFTEVAERTGLATEKVKDLTWQMAEAGRSIPGGVDALSTGFANMGSGIIRARNPIVQLIAATGILHGNAKQVAATLMKMNPEQAMKLGVAAIEKMGNKMKDVPLSMGETISSIKALREEIFELLGSPIANALKGPLGEIRQYFVANRAEITKWAETVGHEVGDWLTSTVKYIEAHGDEIKEGLKEGAQAIMTAASALGAVVHFLWDHRKTVEALYGGKLAAGAVMGAGKALAGGIESVGGAAGAGELLLFAAAMGSVVVAVDQGIKLWGELPSKMDDADAKLRALYEASYSGQIEWAKQLRDEVVVLNPEMVQLANTLADMTKINAKIGAMTDRYTASQLTFQESEADRGGARAKAAVEGFMIDLDTAVQTQSHAALEHMATFLTTHGALLDAMHTAGVDLTKEGKFLVGALEGLAGGAGHMRAEELKGIIQKQLKDQAVKDQHIYFTGPVHVAADFRNTDPDRMIIEFKRNLARNALAKAMASTQVPHTVF
jgi:hypothetical protein